MPLDLTLTFPDSPDASAIVSTGLKVRRYELNEALSGLFELTIEALSPEPAIPDHVIVGHRILVDFNDEPFLKRITGVVREVTQRTAVVGGDSLYVWTVVPPLWLTTRRRDHRIFQDMSVPEIVEAVLADPAYAGRIQGPVKTLAEGHEKREYVVQYGETDWRFVSRILAEEGIASYFDHAAGGAWVLIDDTSTLAPDGSTDPIPYRETSHLDARRREDTDAPHVLGAVVTTRVETSAATVRDYDFERPDFVLEAKRTVAPVHAFTNELPLEAYRFAAGTFDTQAAGDARAQRHLDADRAACRRVLCSSSFTLPPGSRMTLADHPRSDLCADFLVVRARTVIEAEADEHSAHELELMDLSARFRPPLLDKPRVAGTQTATVVGAEGEEIDVDKHGRVLVEFRWDRRDRHVGATSRRVRVSQGWAGADRGFVTLPRVRDEVIVAYLDGDPDQPIIVGRVHNGTRAAPLNLPSDKTVSVWRSRSTPGGAGHNEVLMDDAAGAERLELRAQQDLRTEALRDAVTIVGRNQQVIVRGARGTTVRGDSTSRVEGAQHHEVVDQCTIAGTDAYAEFTELEIKADSILIHTAGARIHLTSGAIHLDAPVIKLSASGSTIAMAGDVDIEGTPIRLNC